MLIFFGVWAAVATVLAVYFWSRARYFWSRARSLNRTVGFLVRFVQDKTDYELDELMDVIYGYIDQDNAR